MKKNIIKTSKPIAKVASKILKKATDKKVLSVAGIALVNAKKHTK
jgi:hypothetical protein